MLSPMTFNPYVSGPTNDEFRSLLARHGVDPGGLEDIGDTDGAVCISDPSAVDAPLIYVSPLFCELTGYAKAEVACIETCA